MTVASDIRRFADFFRDLTEAADTLDQMQSMEETALATEQRVANAQNELTRKAAEIADADRQLVDIRAKASESVKNAGKRAQEKADSIVATGETQAAAVLSDARVQAASIIDAARTEHAALTEQIVGMGEQLVRMTDDKKALDETLSLGRAALDELEGKLAAAREAVAKLLG